VAALWSCAHISDLHVVEEGRLAAGAIDTAPFLEAAVEHINRLQPLPDLVLATGDLVDHGAAAEYARLARLFAGLAPPLYLLPGNHDDRDALRAAFPAHHYLGHCGPVDYVVDGPVRLMALDTLVPGSPGGHLSRRQLDWLDDQLSRDTNRPALVALHHPPFATGIGHMDRMGLDDVPARQLATVIGRHAQVERVVSGHLHRAISRRFAGTVAATVPGVAHAVALDLRDGARAAWTFEPPAVTLYVWRADLGVVAHQSAIGSYPAELYRD
jgi:3',5'-cyclic AMP phosphodiesterase CpdA